MRRFFRLFAVILLWFTSAAVAQADKRVALVIGNADYTNVAALSNPINDATAIGAALTRLGFTVRNQTDLGFDSMRRALNEFAREANGADIAVVYYAGHGMEFDGQNYLIPVDARLGTDLDVPYEAISLTLALNALDGARGTRLLILDACRDNPFASTMRIGAKSRSIGRGLARVEPSVGTIVAYAAKEGTTADDGDGEHSPFAAALLQHIEEPGIDIQFLFRKVRDSVLEATNGNQEPFTYGSLPGRTVLLSPEKPSEPAVVERGTESSAGQEIAAEVAFWSTIQNSGDRALYQSYLKQYPNGRFAALAGIFIDRIDAEAAAKASDEKPTEPPATVTPATPDVVVAPAVEPAAPSVPAPDVTTAPAGIGEVAALAPDALPPEATAKPDKEFIRDVQEELARVGCSAGRPDGVWGRKSRSAAESFGKYASLTLASLDPSVDLLAALKAAPGRVCPLVCGARYEASGDTCILKTCPNGQRLGSNGSCFTPPPAVKGVAPANTAKAGGKSACRLETPLQCVDRLTSADRSEAFPSRTIEVQCNDPGRRIRICR